jgi:Tropomodulin
VQHFLSGHVLHICRCTYHCEKAPTGPLNRKALLDYIYEQAKKTPDRADYVPHVPGVIRGTKWIPPPQVPAIVKIMFRYRRRY